MVLRFEQNSHRKRVKISSLQMAYLTFSVPKFLGLESVRFLLEFNLFFCKKQKDDEIKTSCQTIALRSAKLTTVVYARDYTDKGTAILTRCLGAQNGKQTTSFGQSFYSKDSENVHNGRSLDRTW
jgi:hypothetical protein